MSRSLDTMGRIPHLNGSVYGSRDCVAGVAQMVEQLICNQLVSVHDLSNLDITGQRLTAGVFLTARCSQLVHNIMVLSGGKVSGGTHEPWALAIWSVVEWPHCRFAMQGSIPCLSTTKYGGR